MLHHFFQTGRYEPPRKDDKDYVAVTNAPSMDIAKSSNFERILFDISGFDHEKVQSWYSHLREVGYFEVDSENLAKIRTVFSSSTSSDSERLETIRTFGQEYQHGIDPHTAAAVVPWMKGLFENDIPVVYLETSHIAQFTSELEALGIDVPGMHEFDTILDRMKQAEPREGVQYLHTGNDFSTIFPDIEKVMKTQGM
jgi:threonine synthase